MIVLLATFFTDIEKNFERFVMNCLAVAGGYVVGYILSGMLLVGFEKSALKKKKLPDGLKKSVRLVAGLLIALLVALYVFRGFGSGGEGPGGPGTGVGDSKNDKKGDDPQQPPSKETTTPKPIELPKGTGERTLLGVTFLGGGDVTGGRAYMLGNEKKTFAELTEAIKIRRKEEPNGIKLIFGRSGADPVSRQSTGVIALEEWAVKENIGFEWPGEDKKTP
jgi:hypothetical protein